MRYVLANPRKAEAAGFRMFGRIMADRAVVLNEKEVLSCDSLQGPLEQRAASIAGRIMTHNDLKNLIRNKGR